MINTDTKVERDHDKKISALRTTMNKEKKINNSEEKHIVSSYGGLVCNTVDKIEEVEEYFNESQVKRELPKNFAKRIIELENLIEFHHSIIDENIIEKLAELYKKGVEYYAGISTETKEFYYDKLTRLFMDKNVLNVIKKKNIVPKINTRARKKSSAALRKLLSSKFSLHLTYFQANAISKKMIIENDVEHEMMKGCIRSELDKQRSSFITKLQSIRRKSTKPSKKNKSVHDDKKTHDQSSTYSDKKVLNKNNFDTIIDEFYKNFFLRSYIQLNENSIKYVITTLNEIYDLNLKNFNKYETEIHNLQMMKKSEEDENYGPYLDLMIHSVEKEKSNHVTSYNTIFTKLIRKMKNKIRHNDINSYRTIQQIKQNLLIKLLSILK